MTRWSQRARMLAVLSAGLLTLACPPSPQGKLPAPSGLVCRAKDGKIDVAWAAVPSATGYTVTRRGAGASTPLGVTTAVSFADIGLANGVLYQYEVATLDASGLASGPSLCLGTPAPLGTAPDPVSALACRPKSGKVDLTWPASPLANSYLVYRASGGGQPVQIAETTSALFADVGLANDAALTYTVRAKRGTAVADASPACVATPSTRRPPGNLPPEFATAPLTTALVRRVWYYDADAADPEGGAVQYALESSPPEMALDAATGLLVWAPTAEQAGPHAVRVVATDPQGARGVQEFTVDVAAANEAPVFTSTPAAYAKVGVAYAYDADVFDRDGDPVRFELAGEAPSGLVLASDTGSLSWTPGAAEVGRRALALRATDVAGNQTLQQWAVEVVRDPLEIRSPHGSFEVRAGETLTLPLEASYARAGFRVTPPGRSVAVSGGEFRYTPGAAEAGLHDFVFEASLGDLRATSLVTVNVVRDTRAPVIEPIGPQTVKVGELLRLQVVASDPDGDALRLSAPGLALGNAFFDEISGRFEFRPAAEQAGSASVTFAATDGSLTAQVSVPITVEAAPGSIEALDLVVDKAQSPTFSTAASLTGSVAGEVRPPAALAPPALVTGLSPASLRQGRTADVVLAGSATAFDAATTTAEFGDGLTVESFEVLSPTSARARVRASEAAAIGVRAVRIRQAGLEVPSIVGFSVEKGAATISGILRDPFTEQPLSGARVSVGGTAITVTTGADGRFSLEDVPAGAHSVVFTTANYEAKSVDVSIGANQGFEFSGPVDLRALARPFSAGGSLPRAAKLASLLDRGVSERGAKISQEQAEALVLDTILVVGGDQVGVYDSAGQQMNPAVEGAGVMTLRPEGVRAQARALVQADVTTLGELLAALRDVFQWAGDDPMDVADGLGALQEVVDEAWQNPLDPNNAMAIVLFNDGRDLSARAPLLSSATPLNRFQSFLLLSSFLVHSYGTLSLNLDAQLRARGVDPSVFEDADPSVPAEVIERLRNASVGSGLALDRAIAAAAGLVFGAEARADVAIVVSPANAGPVGTLGRFEQMWKKAKYEALKSAVWDGVVGLAAFAAGQYVMAQLAGSTGGMPGMAMGIGLATVVMDGVISSLMQKIFIGLMLDVTLDTLQPQPPVLESAKIVGNKVYLVFSKSVTQNVNDANLLRKQAADQGTPLPPAPGSIPGLSLNPQLVHFTYQLYRFRDAIDDSMEAGELQNGAFLRGVAGDPDKYVFVIPVNLLQTGANYFRVRTIQYIDGSQDPLGDRTIPIPSENSAVGDMLDASERLTTKVKFDLDEGIVHDIKTQAKQRFDATYETSLDQLKNTVQDDAAAVALEQAKVEAQAKFKQTEIKQMKAKTDAFAHDTKIESRQASRLVKYAQKEGVDPLNFQKPGTVEYKKAQEILGYPESQPVPQSMQDQLRLISQDSRKLSTAQSSLPVQTQALAKLETQRSNLLAKIEAGETSSLKAQVSTVDPDGKPTGYAINVKPDPDGLAEIDQLIVREKAKIDLNQSQITSIKQRAPELTDGVFANTIGTDRWRAYQFEMKATGVKLQNAGTNLDAQLTSYVQAENKYLNSALKQERSLLAKDVNKAIGAVGDVVGPGMLALGFLGEFYDRIKVLGSEFSAPFVYVRGPSPRALAPSLKAHPNVNNWRGMLATQVRTVNRPPPNKPIQSGDLVTAFPADGFDSEYGSLGDVGISALTYDVQFPPEYMAIDSKGIVYAINAASTDLYGGRIFRFVPRPLGKGGPQFTREYAGQVNYYSLTLQYGHPAAPLAMTSATALHPEGLYDDLFIANYDLVKSKKNVLRVPVSAIERFPAAYAENAGNRSHLAGEVVYEDDRFDFTPPVDMAAGPERFGALYNRVYLADGPRLFVLRENVLTGERDVKVLIQPAGSNNRRLTGLAFDSGGSLFFADYASGEVFMIAAADLAAVEDGTKAEPCLLRVNRPGSALHKPVYLALDHEGRNLFASTEDDGLVVVGPVPALLQGAERFKTVALSRFGKEGVAIKIGQEGACREHFVVEPSQDDLLLGTMPLRVEVLDEATNRFFWQDLNLTLSSRGGTLVDLEGAP